MDRNGRVITAQELDAEIREAYELHIVAIVADGHRAETRLDIRVMDANDNAPYISRGTPIRVPEGTELQKI